MNRAFHSVISILVSWNVDHEIINQTEAYLERLYEMCLSEIEEEHNETVDDVLEIINEVQNGEEYSHVRYQEHWGGINIACNEIRKLVLELKGVEE